MTHEIDSKSLGRRLKHERKRLGMSQDAFGKVGGVQRATQYLYEQGDRIPSIEYLVRIVTAGADLGYLVFGEKNYGVQDGWNLDKDVLLSVYALVDEFARDSKGRLLDLEHRLAFFKAACNLVSGKSENEVDWESIRVSIKNIVA